MKRTLLRNIFNDDVKINDKKIKLIEERVAVVEQHIPELKNRTSEYATKKVSDQKCMDKIVLVLNNFSKSESISASVKTNTETYAKVLSEISSQKELIAECLNTNVVEELAEFGKRCKHLRSDIKAATTAADREAIRQRQLQRLEMLRDQDRERISTAEAEAIKARSESAKAAKILEEHADVFEQSKLQGLRSALLSWTTLELRYHARCLELFTDAYRAAAQINVSSDHQDFRCKLHDCAPNSRLSFVRESTDHGSSLQIGTPPGRL